jgi:hypothetical protein
VRFLRATPFQSFSRSMSHIVPTAAPVSDVRNILLFFYNKNTHTIFDRYEAENWMMLTFQHK